VLIYLNKDWQESFGGALELWDKDMAEAATRIVPIFNRCAIFTTTDYSYHGHPEPLACPPDRARRSRALYSYTNGAHEEERSVGYSTLDQERPGGAHRAHGRTIGRVAPPALVDAAKQLSRRRRSKQPTN
jgi:hypothetical protein